MTLLLVGLCVFLGVHVLPTFTGLRSKLKGALGAQGYRGLFALLSLAGLVLIVVGKGQADYVHLYTPPTWGRHVTMALLLGTTIGLPAAYLPSNIRRVTAHPMLWAVFLWGVAHLASNGDAASTLLFGSFAVYAVFDIWSANRRGAVPRKEKVSWGRELLVVVIGLALYVGLLVGHPYLFGAAVLRG